MKKLIVTITGPSSSGKSTLEKMLTQEGSPFASVRSVTTRPPRAGEVNGVHYDFIDHDDFMIMLDRGDLVEAVEFGPYRYGATQESFEQVFAQGKIAVIVVEPEGRRQYEDSVERLGWDILTVYVSNPSSVRMQRLVDRFIADVEHLELGGAAFQKVKQGFVKRLELVMNVETLWDTEALQAISPYDLRFWEFDERNDAMTMQRVVDKAMERALGVGSAQVFSTAEKAA